MIPSELIEQLKSLDPELIKEAILQLSSFDDPAAIPYLEPMKKNKDAGVRYFSKKAIDKLKKYPPIEKNQQEPIISSEINFQKNENSDTNKMDNDFLPEDIYNSDNKDVPLADQNINLKNADEYLIKLDSKSTQDRLEAIFYLKRIPDKDIALTLTETFDNENDAMVKAVLVKILPDIFVFNNNRVIACLDKGLKDEDNRVRANSVEALEKIFQNHKSSLEDQRIIQMILPLIKDNDNRTKANSLKLFFTFDKNLVLKELEKMLESEKIWMKDSALFALGEIKSSKVAPILIKATQDSEEEIRLKAFTKLAELNKPCYLEPVIDKLFSALADTEHELHYIANMIISQIERSAIESSDYYFENLSLIDKSIDLAISYKIFSSAESLFLSHVCHTAKLDIKKLKRLFKELFKHNETNRLLKIMECLEKKSEVSNELIVHIAETCFAMGHFSRALNYYQKICKTSHEAMHTYRLGELFLINEMPGKAIEILTPLNNSSFNPVHVKRLLAEAMIQKGLFENAFYETGEMIKYTNALEQNFKLELIYDIALKFDQLQQTNYASNLYSIIDKENSNFKDVTSRLQWINKTIQTNSDSTNKRSLNNMQDDIFTDFQDDSEMDTTIISVSNENEVCSTPDTEAYMAIISQKIDPRYQDLKLIGTGGMGKIFRALDVKLDRLVALKVFSDCMESKSDKGLLFLKEAQTSAKINHYNIVQIYDFALHNETAYIVMEYVDGVTIRDLLKKKKIPPVIMKRLAIQICEAFIHAHDCGIIHKDIKPENIMINKSGRVKIMDFGIATSDFSKNENDTLIMGTCYYMSPEQLLGGKLDPRSDIYSMGITFYEMLAGKPPFYRGNLKYQHLHVHPEPLTSMVDNTLQTLNSIILKCLEKDPDMRYSSCRKLLKELKNAQI